MSYDAKGYPAKRCSPSAFAILLGKCRNIIPLWIFHFNENAYIDKHNCHSITTPAYLKHSTAHFFLLLFLSLTGFSVSAQNLNLVWTKQIGGANRDEGHAIAVDNNGNVYTTGFFTGTTDFDPGSGVYNMTAQMLNEPFISKLDASGNFVWAKQFAGADWLRGLGGESIVVDVNGSVYVTGQFTNTVDFDPGPATFSLTPIAYEDIFVVKLDTDGNFIWAKQIGGSSWDQSTSLTIDANENVYITGNFVGTTDFDPGPGTYSLSANGYDIFVCKLNSQGDFIWAKNAGGGNNQFGTAIAVDGYGNSYVTGNFYGTADFDPGPGITNETAIGLDDIFILKLDVNGSFLWVKRMGGADSDQGHAIKVDGNGNIYTAGYFNSTGDFDPGVGAYNMASAGQDDAYLSKLDPSGNFVWALRMGANGSENIRSLAIDAAGSIYAIGKFMSTVDFDPGTEVYSLTAISVDIFVSKYDASGNLLGAIKMGGVSGDEGMALALDNTGNVFVTGYFQSTADFDPCDGVYNFTTFGQEDIFIAKLGMPVVTIAASSANICTGSAVTFTATPVNAGPSPSYQWQVNGVNAGTNSNTFTTTTLNNNDQIRVFLTNYTTCYPPLLPLSNTITITVNTSIIPAVSIVSSSTNICAGSAVTFTATPTNGGPSPAYQWQINGMNAGANTSTFTTNALVSGDVVTVIMTANVACASPLAATSNSIPVTVTSSVTPAVNITASTSAICAGSSVTFTSTAAHAGTSPTYQWKINGNNVGTNAPTFTTSILADGDVVALTMISGESCVSSATATSNSISIDVSHLVTPSITITSSAASVCAGTSITFTASIAHGGSAPVYHWQVNGIDAGINTPVFKTATLTNGDVVTATLLSDVACATASAVRSNAITIATITTPVPSVSIKASASIICVGGAVTFTAMPINGGAIPAYQWKINGINAGTNSPAFTSNALSNGDRIECVMTNDPLCPSPVAVRSNTISIVIDPALCAPRFYMPTAFTPNHDGKNDLLKPTLFGNVTAYTFSIYNRWGQKIFETSDRQRGWDGKIAGRDADANVFVWMCSIQFNGQPVENRRGTVVLIR